MVYAHRSWQGSVVRVGEMSWIFFKERYQILSKALWLLIHPEKRNLARIRAFIDWLEEQLEQDQWLFQGDAPNPNAP